MITGKWKITLALALLSASSSVGKTQPQSPEKSSAVGSHQYFPAGAFNGSRSEDGSRAAWYACTLTALKEPSLFELRSTETSEVYRFLWLPSFHDPISVRLAIKPDGSGVVVARSVDRKTGLLVLKMRDKTIPNGTGKLTMDTVNDVGNAQVQDVLRELQDLQFWSLKTTEEAQTPTQEGTASTLQATMVPLPPLDGARWILEGVRGGQYHVVDRWSPKDDEYARLCRFLLTLAKVEEKNLY